MRKQWLKQKLTFGEDLGNDETHSESAENMRSSNTVLFTWPWLSAAVAEDNRTSPLLSITPQSLIVAGYGWCDRLWTRGTIEAGRRKANINTGAIAGLNVMQMINEPTAATLAYGQRFVRATCLSLKQNSSARNFFQVAILTCREQVVLAIPSLKSVGSSSVESQLSHPTADLVESLLSHLVSD
ncbi:hypothetical protein KIW84_051632 [Lathyrus oleraceus]|uniref:Uncharacterized protein n=1 Tax=Pisum sativum TaxID=3888 RepID=A0A9D4WKL4_PEA|nr:hypothetical protein KIW84_051632 [Pisum sativum]